MHSVFATISDEPRRAVLGALGGVPAGWLLAWLFEWLLNRIPVGRLAPACWSLQAGLLGAALLAGTIAGPAHSRYLTSETADSRQLIVHGRTFAREEVVGIEYRRRTGRRLDSRGAPSHYQE